jgi:hypothetical protein
MTAVAIWIALGSGMAAQPAGHWVLESRKEVIGEPTANAKPHCRYGGESQDRGAKYAMTCTSPVSKQTTVTSGHVGWKFSHPLDRLLPGTVIKVGGVVENTSTPRTGPTATCSVSWNTFGFTKGQAVAPGASGGCDGELTIPKPGMRRDGTLITEGVLSEALGFGNATGVTRHLLYRWREFGATSSGTPGDGRSSSGSDAADFSGRWVVGTQTPGISLAECSIRQSGNRVDVTGRMVYNNTEVLWKATGTIQGRTIDTELVYTKPYPAWGNAGDGKWVMTLSADGRTLKGWYRNRNGQVGDSHYVRP